VIYGIRLLEVLQEAPVETHVVISLWGERTIVAETTRKPADVRRLATYSWEEDDDESPLASGSYLTDGMIIAPCSMKSLAAIANGYSETLMHRAADVTLKERRKLLLLVRESPLSLIHLENMVQVAKAGAMVVPPLPAFYARPQTVDEIVDHTVGRVLDQFAIDHALIRRWGSR
jgi:polyprenyl P-hydroxybenzoate/phenylacrylic acid decarboxylase-like protein